MQKILGKMQKKFTEKFEKNSPKNRKKILGKIEKKFSEKSEKNSIKNRKSLSEK